MDTMPAKPIGAALSRDISTGENGEKDLETFIAKRYKERRLSEGSNARAEEAPWMESVRRHEAARDARLREEWREYHLGHARALRANLEALIIHHEEQAQRYLPKGAV